MQSPELKIERQSDENFIPKCEVIKINIFHASTNSLSYLMIWEF